MQVSQVRVYEEDNDDLQYQNPDAVGPQEAIPGGVWDLELSWDRKRGYMRCIVFRKDDIAEHRARPKDSGEEIGTWWFKEWRGNCQMLGAVNASGRLYMRGMARIDDATDTLTLYRDKEAKPHPLVSGGVRREITFNRMCYRRLDAQWRLRDEEMPWEHPDALVIVDDMVGDVSAYWDKNDNIGHLYHRGYVIIKDGTCHMYDPVLQPR